MTSPKEYKINAAQAKIILRLAKNEGKRVLNAYMQDQMAKPGTKAFDINVKQTKELLDLIKLLGGK